MDNRVVWTVNSSVAHFFLELQQDVAATFCPFLGNFASDLLTLHRFDTDDKKAVLNCAMLQLLFSV